MKTVVYINLNISISQKYTGNQTIPTPLINDTPISISALISGTISVLQENMRRSTNAGLMLSYCLRRWPNITPALGLGLRVSWTTPGSLFPCLSRLTNRTHRDHIHVIMSSTNTTTLKSHCLHPQLTTQQTRYVHLTLF